MRWHVFFVRPGRLAAAAAVCAVLVAASGSSLQAARPPGSTNAVLSAVLDGVAEVVRHWPGRPRDVVVRPWEPVFWDDCLPGRGAIMVLVTAPIDIPPVWAMANPSYFDPERAVAPVFEAVLRRTASVVSRIDDEEVRRNIARSFLPGQVAYEALKSALATEIRSMAVYEKYGYAVFMFIRSRGWLPWEICRVTYEAVPEGYGIPYVR